MAFSNGVKKVLSFEGGRKTLIITIGNTLRSDDGVGPYIAGHLESKPGGFTLINAGDRPESIVDKALEAKPGKIVMIDAADFGGTPGEIRIIPEEHIPQSTLTTHMFPLPIIAKLLKEDTDAEVYFIGIQAKNMNLGEGLCDEVQEAADCLVKEISNVR